MSNTLDYYNQQATLFVEGTIDVDFSAVQDLFLSYLPENSRILDFGCGSGRDSKYFLDRGYQVDATDGSEELCVFASNYTGISVRQMLFQELDCVDVYDGIWACASILHVPKHELPDILSRMIRALHRNGYIYTSFKYGDFEGERNGRFFSNYTEDSIQELISSFPELSVEKMWISGDVRADRETEQWLNLILQKNTTASS